MTFLHAITLSATRRIWGGEVGVTQTRNLHSGRKKSRNHNVFICAVELERKSSKASCALEDGLYSSRTSYATASMLKTTQATVCHISGIMVPFDIATVWVITKPQSIVQMWPASVACSCSLA